MKLLKIFMICCVLLGSNSVLADKPVCYETHGGFCQYTGFVDRIYINSSKVILLYFDTVMDDGEWEKAGYDSGNKSALMVRIDDGPEFAELFYSTALAAQASKRKVTIQMRGTHGGYLLADRIWLAQN